MAVKTLYGAPVKEMTHKNYTADTLWKEIQDAITRGDVTTVGSPGTPTGSHDEKQANGISYNHAFTLLGLKEVTDAAGNKIKLVKIRNPWGAEEYTGDYSDKSTKWTPALR